MHITHVNLPTSDLKQQLYFYQGILRLPLTEEVGRQITFQVGASTLTFYKTEHQGSFHLAFTIPTNLLRAAKSWITQKLRLVTDAAHNDEFPFETWNAHALYFYDPAGNILELIARHTLDNAAPKPFRPEHLLNISEVGLCTGDVRPAIQELCSHMAVQPYHDSNSPDFCAVGDHHGLLIVVKAGRAWFPDLVQQADFAPLTLHLTDDMGKRFILTAPPYSFRLEG